jgi:hypothetical protein
MKTIQKTTLHTALAAMLIGQPALAQVTFVGNDWTTDSYWRTPSVVKPNDVSEIDAIDTIARLELDSDALKIPPVEVPPQPATFSQRRSQTQNGIFVWGK